MSTNPITAALAHPLQDEAAHRHLALQPKLPPLPQPLWDEAASRQAEAQAMADCAPHALMARAGEALARLARALVPHGGLIWVACGPGNNGGDGLVAARFLHSMGCPVWVTRVAAEPRAGSDAEWALRQAREAGVPVHDTPPDGPWTLAIDALFGLGARSDMTEPYVQWLQLLRRSEAVVLCADMPSGLHPGTGQWFGPPDAMVRPAGLTHTLSLLTLKTGLYTGAGRDASGQVWLDTLGVSPDPGMATATLLGPPLDTPGAHDTHKGHFGHVWVVGGDQGMSGAAWLAGQSALRRGAGRVHVQLLAPEVNPLPHLLALMTAQELPAGMSDLTVVAGCGGGRAIASALPRVLSTAPRLVLDADALNAIATDHALCTLLRHRAKRQRLTVLTPHPLEAARLLSLSTAQVQADRLDAARRLAQATGCVVVLKGSGSVVADPTGRVGINPTGNHRLATAGSGDVLAGWIGARLARGEDAFGAACAAVHLHGLQAEQMTGDGPLIADHQ
jgi:ADP-dependent NAD(P)H-hydrate dehydratase / NAD(P)H-hydrate epimerase